MSQSEISQSISRSKYAGLLNGGKRVRCLAFLEFLQHGLRYIFPQQLGPVLRGIPTAHSAPPLSDIIRSQEHYVWPFGKGTMRGHSIVPLYPSVVLAVLGDKELHELLALADALRVGRNRERQIAIRELKTRIENGK